MSSQSSSKRELTFRKQSLALSYVRSPRQNAVIQCLIDMQRSYSLGNRGRSVVFPSKKIHRLLSTRLYFDYSNISCICFYFSNTSRHIRLKNKTSSAPIPYIPSICYNHLFTQISPAQKPVMVIILNSMALLSFYLWLNMQLSKV